MDEIFSLNFHLYTTILFWIPSMCKAIFGPTYLLNNNSQFYNITKMTMKGFQKD